MDEKILSILAEIKVEMNSRFDSLESRISSIENDVRSIKLYQENVLDENIRLLAENVSSANERLMTIESDVTELKDSQVVSDVLAELSAAFRK